MYQNKDHINLKHIVIKSNNIDVSNQKSLLEISKKISKLLNKGTNLFLYGEIGVGKTTFARFLINYLSTADKHFTATDLYTSINKKVTKLSSSLGVTQVPVLASLPRSGHVGPDFVFLKK